MIRFFFLIHCRVDPTRGAVYGEWTEMTDMKLEVLITAKSGWYRQIDD